MNPYLGLQVSLHGFISVWHLGIRIAVVDSNGVIVLLRYRTPVWLVEYILNQPKPETTKWN